MKLNRFVGATTREVLRQVRAALGPDALIVSNRTVADGIEVIAGLDPSLSDADGPSGVQLPTDAPTAPAVHPAVAAAPAPSGAPAPARAPQPAAAVPAPPRSPDAPMPAAWSGGAPPGGEVAVQAAIDALRGALESRMDGLLWGGAQGPGREPAAMGLFRGLLEAGFSMPLVRALVERLPRDMDRAAALAWARNELVTHLPVLRDENAFLGDGGVYALVGPTGVGKTTTLAKLAARCIAREGREHVAMLTTDMFRIGAAEQLQIYGRLMGVPALSVRDAASLRQALEQLGSRRIILIDTTGISQRDRNVAEQAALLHAAGRPVRRLLVLNAASQGDTLDEVAHAYRHGAEQGVVGCIITKLDETTRLAPALDTAIRHRLPIHYVSMGQKVPEHMDLADPQVLVDRALQAAGRGRALYAPSEADLAALCREAGVAPESADPARRRRLLAAALRNGAGAVSDLDAAIDWLEADPACAQARANWRASGSAGAGESAAPGAGTLRDEALAMARRQYAQACDRHLLVVHGKATLDGAGLPAGTLLSSLLMTDRGAALCAPVAQLKLQHGGLCAHAPAEPMTGNAVDALLHRVQALGRALDGVPLLHLFDMGSTALWQAMNAGAAAWLARGPGALRVMQEGCGTTLAAVSRGLGYLPAGQVRLHGSVGAGRLLDLWASGTEVALAMRGKQDQPLRMVCARLVDPADGAIVRQLYGLTNVRAGQADAPAVARWLVQHEQAKPAFRYMQSAWPALPQAADTHALARQAQLAAQWGAACWQLARAPEAVRTLLAALAEGRLNGARLPAAMLRCFAMLEMSAGG